MQPKLIISYRDLKDADFFTKATNIVSGLTACLWLPLPWPADYPTLLLLSDAVTDLGVKIGLAADGDSGQIAARDVARELVATYIREIAPYAELKAQGDVTKLEATGYDLRRPLTHTAGPGQLPGPTNVRAEHNGTGKVIARGDSVKGAAAYEGWINYGDTLNEALWSEKTNTAGCSRIEMNDVTSGAMASIRIRAIGPKGPGEWSDVAQIRVL